jgi:hypothetical protein
MWSYSAKQATDLENIIVQHEHKATAYELFYDSNPERMDSLHKFGEWLLFLIQSRFGLT